MTSLQSELLYLMHCCPSVSTVCFVLWIVDLSHLRKSATNQRENIQFYVLLYKSSSEILGMLEEAYGKAKMKKMQVCERYKRFRGGHETVGFFCKACQLVDRWR
jgi:hypothetical protein